MMFKDLVRVESNDVMHISYKEQLVKMYRDAITVYANQVSSAHLNGIND